VATLNKGLKFTRKPSLHTRRRVLSGKASAAAEAAERTIKLPTSGYTAHLLAQEGKLTVGEQLPLLSCLCRPRCGPEAAGPTTGPLLGRT
jgi:hypothetical protein